MRIGIAGPFNCSCVQEYFTDKDLLPKINITATSVNIYVKTLLSLGHEVVVFTINPYAKEDCVFIGNKIKIYIIAHKFFIRGFGRYRIHKKIRRYIKKELNTLDVLHAQWTYEYALSTLFFGETKPVFCTVRDWCPVIFSMAKKILDKYYWAMSLFIFNKVMKQNRIHFIANSKYIYNCIKQKYPDKNPFIIPNPVQSEKIIKKRNEYPTNHIFVSIKFYYKLFTYI